MLFWIVAAALTAAVVLLIVPPLLRPRADTPAARGAYDLEVYRDQLAELERDVGRGLISEAQAAAARAEVGRRMLHVAAEAPAPVETPRRARLLAAGLAVLIPLGALAVYLPMGHPGLPALPLASRDLARERGGAPAGGPPPQVMAALQKLKQHLADNPKDVEGWDLLGRTYARAAKYDLAAEAFRHALDAAPGEPELLSAWAEMLTNGNDGIVSEQARQAFEQALAKEPKEPRAQFYLALAREQAGDLQGALDRWRAQMAATPADAPWLSALQGRIADAAGKLGLDVAKVMPAPLPPEKPADTATSGMSDEQKAMVRDMVDGLAAKLKDNPGDVDGWLRLARSYTVLGEHERALDAARQAVGHAPGRADAQLALADALLSRGSKPGQGQGQGQGQAAEPMPDEAVTALRAALAAEPANKEALWLLGLNAANLGRKDEAGALWTRLLAQMDPKDPDHAFLQKRIAALKTGG